MGGAGDDALRGGGGRNELRGGDGADLFVLDGRGGRAVTQGFDPDEGDRVVIAARELLLADGSLDGARLDLVDAGAALLIRADLDGTGAFEAIVARLAGAAGLTEADILANAVTLA